MFDFKGSNNKSIVWNHTRPDALAIFFQKSDKLWHWAIICLTEGKTKNKKQKQQQKFLWLLRNLGKLH